MYKLAAKVCIFYLPNTINDNPELFLEDFWIEFGVLTLCRIRYTLENQNIISKLQSANYILEKIDDNWKPIIKEAVRIREGKRDTYFTNKQLRADVTIHFIREMIQSCNNKYFDRKLDDGI